jgi:hypothetical protein
VSGDILAEIDAVVKVSDELFDEVIEERAKANGLARVPRNVTEVVDVLFGHVHPKPGKPYLINEDEAWSSESIHVGINVSATDDRLSEYSSEIMELHARHRLERGLAIDSEVLSARNRDPRQRREFAMAWRDDAEHHIAYAYSRGDITDRIYLDLRRKVGDAYFTMIAIRPGETIPAGPDEEIVQTGAGRWRLQRRQPAVERTGEPRRAWWRWNA